MSEHLLKRVLLWGGVVLFGIAIIWYGVIEAQWHCVVQCAIENPASSVPGKLCSCVPSHGDSHVWKLLPNEWKGIKNTSPFNDKGATTIFPLSEIYSVGDGVPEAGSTTFPLNGDRPNTDVVRVMVLALGIWGPSEDGNEYPGNQKSAGVRNEIRGETGAERGSGWIS